MITILKALMAKVCWLLCIFVVGFNLSNAQDSQNLPLMNTDNTLLPSEILPMPTEDTRPDLTEAEPSPPAAEMPSDSLNDGEKTPQNPSEPVSAPPLTPENEFIHQEMGILLINDEEAGNQYVTSLDSGGRQVKVGSEPALFGAKRPAGRNQRRAAWYPHPKVQDVRQYLNGEPLQAFGGLANLHHWIEGDIRTLTLPDDSYVNLLFTEGAFEQLRQAAIGSMQTLKIVEQLHSGGQRQIESRITKQGQITLRKPQRLACYPDTIEGVVGQSCLLRELSVEGQGLHLGDIQFVLKGDTTSSDWRYRVGQSWHPLNVPLPILEFVGSQGIQVFIPQSQQSPQNRLSPETTSSMQLDTLRAAFFSAARYPQGDWYAIKLGQGGKLPGESEVQLSRIEMALIEDRVSEHRYVTTLNHQSSRGKAVLLYGMQQPVAGTSPAIWYHPANGESERTEAENGQLIPLEHFTHWSSQGEASNQVPTLTAQLSEPGWMAIQNMSVGDSIQWRYQQNSPQPANYMSHVVKKVALLLSEPAHSVCRTDVVQGLRGLVCEIRTIHWSGETQNLGDIRFVIRSRSQWQGVLYRVNEQWYPTEDSTSLAEFAQSKGIEIFVPVSQEGLVRHSNSGQFQLAFFSASRLGQGDRFYLNIVLPTHNTLPPQTSTFTVPLALIEDALTQNRYVTSLTGGQNSRIQLYGVQNVVEGQQVAKGYLSKLLQQQSSANLTETRGTLYPPHLFDIIDSDSRAEFRMSTAGWQALLNLPLSDSLRVQYQPASESSGWTALFSKQAEIRFDAPPAAGCLVTEVESTAGRICPLRKIHILGALTQAHGMTLQLSSLGLTPEMRLRVGETENWRPALEARLLSQQDEGQVIWLFLPESLMPQIRNRSMTLPTSEHEVATFNKLSLLVKSADITDQGQAFSLPVEDQLKQKSALSLRSLASRASYTPRMLILPQPSPFPTIKSGSTHTLKGSLNAPVTSNEALYVKILVDNLQQSDFVPDGIRINNRVVKVSTTNTVEFPLLNNETSFNIQVQTKPIFEGGSRNNSLKKHTFWFSSHSTPQGASWTTSGDVYLAQIPLPLKSISGDNIFSNQALKFTILPSLGAPDGAGLFLKVTPPAGEVLPQIDWEQAELTNGVTSVKTGDLSGKGRYVSFKSAFDSTKGLTLNLPMTAWYSPDQKSVTLTANGGLKEGASSSVSHSIVISGRNVNVENSIRVEGKPLYGGEIRFVMALTGKLPQGVPLFLKVESVPTLGSALATNQASLVVGENRFPLDLSLSTGKAFTFGQDLSGPLHIVIPLGLPAELPSEDATVTLVANTGDRAESHREARGDAILPQVKMTASISEGAGTLSGEIGEGDLLKTFLIRHEISNIQFNTDKSVSDLLLLRQAALPGAVQVFVNGGSVESDPQSCKLKILNSEQHIRIPAYLTYPHVSGTYEKQYHGCRGEAQSVILGKNANWQSETQDLGVRNLEIQMGFELNNPVSRVILESPQQEWIGTATGQFSLLVKSVWNP